MLVSLNWIKEFVDIPPALTGKDVADHLTLSVCEVEGIRETGGCLGDVQIVHVESTRPHPQADKLKLVTFTNGGSEPLQVVCGAQNVRPGLKTVYAPCGTTLANGIKLEARKIRGVLSEGMLCSSRELGLGEDADGLLELSEDARPGDNFLQHLGRERDILLDIDNKSLTHRPDLWATLAWPVNYRSFFKFRSIKFLGPMASSFPFREFPP